MQLQTFQYTKRSWTVPTLPDLDSDRTLVLIFAAPEFIDDPEPIHALCKQYPNSKVMGCSTAGEIAGSIILDKSLSVAVIKFEKTGLKLAMQTIHNADSSYQTGSALIADLYQDQLRGVFVLSDGLNVNGSELVKGLNNNNNNIIITGGLAGDGSRFKKTWTICDGKIMSDQVIAVGFYGDKVHLGHGFRGGWDIFGVERRITRAKNNVLYELDNKPALSLYKEYLGEKASGLPATGLLFPLSIRQNISDNKPLVRTILGIDEATDSLIFAGDTPVGYLAQMMHANFDRLITGASEAAGLTLKSAMKGHSQKPAQETLLIAISCVGRRLLLGERAEEETEITLASFSPGTQQVGFYSYGEISPCALGLCNLHNQTMTLTCIMEDD